MNANVGDRLLQVKFLLKLLRFFLEGEYFEGGWCCRGAFVDGVRLSDRLSAGGDKGKGKGEGKAKGKDKGEGKGEGEGKGKGECLDLIKKYWGKKLELSVECSRTIQISSDGAKRISFSHENVRN